MQQHFVPLAWHGRDLLLFFHFLLFPLPFFFNCPRVLIIKIISVILLLLIREDTCETLLHSIFKNFVRKKKKTIRRIFPRRVFLKDDDTEHESSVSNKDKTISNRADIFILTFYTQRIQMEKTNDRISMERCRMSRKIFEL